MSDGTFIVFVVCCGIIGATIGCVVTRAILRWRPPFKPLSKDARSNWSSDREGRRDD